MARLCTKKEQKVSLSKKQIMLSTLHNEKMEKLFNPLKRDLQFLQPPSSRSSILTPHLSPSPYCWIKNDQPLILVHTHKDIRVMIQWNKNRISIANNSCVYAKMKTLTGRRVGLEKKKERKTKKSDNNFKALNSSSV